MAARAAAKGVVAALIPRLRSRRLREISQRSAFTSSARWVRTFLVVNLCWQA